MSRPDRKPQVAVDFAPPRLGRRARPLLLVAAALVAVALAAIAVTQLLLR
ncbi:MAG TPA: hypothetical protein VIT43_13465 [Candidatus Dormibacteraeota bacterium]